MQSEMAMQALPAPGSVEEAVQLMQLSNMAPKVAPEAGSVVTGNSGGAPEDEAVWQRRIHPKHRQAVRQFFQRER